MGLGTSGAGVSARGVSKVISSVTEMPELDAIGGQSLSSEARSDSVVYSVAAVLCSPEEPKAGETLEAWCQTVRQTVSKMTPYCVPRQKGVVFSPEVPGTWLCSSCGVLDEVAARNTRLSLQAPGLGRKSVAAIRTRVRKKLGNFPVLLVVDRQSTERNNLW